MSITKRILDWNEKKIEEIDLTDDKHPYLKAVGHGAIAGFIDGAVYSYIPLLFAAYYWMNKANKNK